MTVIVLEAAPPAVRGELTRWFLEVKAGVFVGTVNKKIRELLWNRLCATEQVRGAVLMYSTNSEQGYVMQMHGTPHRKIVEFEGVQLICRDSSTPTEIEEDAYDPISAAEFWEERSKDA